jgi:predicted metalloendopeptidase
MFYVLLSASLLFNGARLLHAIPTGPSIKLSKAEETMVSYLDTSIQPCDDFYSFACGGWFKSVENVTGSISIQGILDGGLKDKVHTIMRTLVTTGLASTDAIWKMHTFFKGCMGNESDASVKELRALMMPLFTEYDFSTVQGRTEAWAFVQRYNSGPLLKLFVRPELEHGNVYGLRMEQSGLGLSPTSYSGDAQVARYRERISHMLQSVLQGAVVIPSNISQTIVDLETKLAHAQIPNDAMWSPEDANVNVVKMNLEDAENVFQDQFDLPLFFKTTGVVKNVTDLSVYPLVYFKQVPLILQSVSFETLQWYFAWTLIRSYESYLPPDFAAADYPDTQRSWDCTWKTEWVFGFAVASLLFPDFDPNGAKDLAEALRPVFRDIILNTSWLDVETQKNALNKLANMTAKVGFPDFTHDRPRLNAFYEHLHVGDNFVKSGIGYETWKFKRNLEQYHEALGPYEWQMTPNYANAYYVSEAV